MPNVRHTYAAAEAIASYKEEIGASNRDIATSLGGEAKEQTIQKLLKWRESGYEADTPFLMDTKATTRAAVSHMKKVLRESSKEELEKILDDLPDDVLDKVKEAAEDSETTRMVHPDKPKPTFEQASERAKASDTEMLKRSQYVALARLSSATGSARAHIRSVVKQYQEFRAVVDDEEWLSDGRERIVGLHTFAALTLGELLEGDLDKQFGNLLDKEGKGK